MNVDQWDARKRSPLSRTPNRRHWHANRLVLWYTSRVCKLVILWHVVMLQDVGPAWGHWGRTTWTIVDGWCSTSTTSVAWRIPPKTANLLGGGLCSTLYDRSGLQIEKSPTYWNSPTSDGVLSISLDHPLPKPRRPTHVLRFFRN